MTKRQPIGYFWVWTFILFHCCTILYFDLCVRQYGFYFFLQLFPLFFPFFVLFLCYLILILPFLVFPYLCQLLIPNWRCLCFFFISFISFPFCILSFFSLFFSSFLPLSSLTFLWQHIVNMWGYGDWSHCVFIFISFPTLLFF